MSLEAIRGRSEAETRSGLVDDIVFMNLFLTP